MERIEKESRKFFAEQKAEKIVRIMPGRFEPDFYISVIAAYDFGVKFLKAFVIVGERATSMPSRIIKFKSFQKD